jgi:hypothetical protein
MFPESSVIKEKYGNNNSIKITTVKRGIYESLTANFYILRPSGFIVEKLRSHCSENEAPFFSRSVVYMSFILTFFIEIC